MKKNPFGLGEGKEVINSWATISQASCLAFLFCFMLQYADSHLTDRHSATWGLIDDMTCPCYLNFQN